MTIKTEVHEYEISGESFEGYIAWDDSNDEHRPGIMVCHEWKGISDNTKMRCEMLAKLGYFAFAPDLFGKDVRPTNNDEAGAQVQKYMGDLELFRGRVNTALNQLHSFGLTQSAKSVAVGYCFGGAAVLELARSGADLLGVASFHGILATSSPAESGAVKCKLLAQHGHDDPMVQPDQVLGFQNEMTAAGADWRMIVHGGVQHSFTNPAAKDHELGLVYSEAADRRSWQAMQDFFVELLG